MLKKLIVLILIITISERAFAQTDTVCIPRKDAIRVLERLEYLKADSAEHEVTKERVADLTNIMNSQRGSITNLTNHVSTLDLRIANYEVQTGILNKALRKQKRKTMLATVTGIIVAGSLTYLLIK